MTSSTPQEPKEIKGWRRSVQEIQLTDHPFDWDSFVLWYGNKLPKYLWGAWKKDVRPIGFTWQKFMRLLRYRTDIGVMWYKGVLPWKEYVKIVSALIDGPIGKRLAKQGRWTTTR